MGLLDNLNKSAAGFGETGNVLQQLTQMIGSPESGGLGGLVRSFQERGLGSVVASWVSTGPNLPIGSDQVTQVLGQERVQQIARTVGADPQVLAGQISNMLPSLIDKLTPAGKLPDGTTAEQIAQGPIIAS